MVRADGTLAPLYVDDDQRDDAAIIEFLLPFAISPDGTALRVAPVTWETLPALTTTHAVFLTFGQVALDNYLTVHVVDRAGAISKTSAHARLGQTAALVADVAPFVAQAIGGTAQAVPNAARGQLRAFALAQAELRATPPNLNAALDALALGDPDVALRVPAANFIARSIWSRTDLSLRDRVRAALVGATPRELLDLAGTSVDPYARLARATAALRTSDFQAAKKELAAAPDESALLPVKAALAQMQADSDGLSKYARQLLTSPTPEAWRWFAELPSGALGPELEAELLNAAPRSPSRRIATMLGLRALSAGPGAFALVDVLELGEAERARVRNSISSKADASAEELLTELDLVEGIELKSSHVPHVAGLLAWQAGLYDQAAEAFEQAKLPHTLARAWLSAGESSRVLAIQGAAGRSRAIAELLVAVTTPNESGTQAADRLLGLAPGSSIVHEAAAAMLKAVKAPQAVMVATRSKSLEPEPTIEKKAAATAQAPTVPVEEISNEVRTRANQSEYVDRLAGFLSRFPEASLRNKHVAIVAFGDEPSGLALYIPDEQAFRDHLTVALARDYNARALHRTTQRVAQMDQAIGDELAAAASADSVLAFDLTSGGRLRFDLFDTQSRSLRSNAASLPDSVQVKKLQWTPIVLGVFTMLAVAGVVGWAHVRRGKHGGNIVVRIVHDPDGKDPSFEMQLSQGGKRPVLGDVGAFRAKLIQSGATQGITFARLPGAETTFRLAQGIWQVHLVGVYVRPDGEVRLDDPRYTRSITLQRDQTQVIEFDLAAIHRSAISNPVVASPAAATAGEHAVAAKAGGSRGAIDIGMESANEPQPAAAGTPGQKLLGRYLIKAQLGAGAMGVVYRAWDENLERDVAIKVLSSELRSHPDALQFFVEEAKALAQLNHPNIVSVFDQSTYEGETYLIMEFVDGRTLDEILRERGRLPLNAALALTEQLCAGLAYVHARRVIHRDIKPANIFISNDRVVKLGDFGLARVSRELTIRKTEIRGTPLYMAPEQIKGTNVSSKSDLYAVGCTLFELVTGRPPFIDGEVLVHHLMTPPPKPSEFEPSLPPSFDALMDEILQKEADQRIESATALRERLRQIAKGA